MSLPGSSYGSDYRTFLVMDRNKVLAQAASRHPELQLGDDIRDLMKELDVLEDYSEKLIDSMRAQQKIETDSIIAGDYVQLRNAQIKIRGLLRRLKICAEQKTEVNDKIENFLDDFTANLPMIFAGTRDEEVAPSILVTPETKAKELEILKREKEFAAHEWRIEQSYIQANIKQELGPQNYDQEEYDLPPPPSLGRGRRPQIPNPSPKKSANRSQASPRRAKKPAGATLIDSEKDMEETEKPPLMKKSKLSNPATTPSVSAIASPSPIPPTPPPVDVTPSASVSGSATGKGGRKRLSRKSTEAKTPSTPEEIAEKKEARAKAKRAKEEEQRKQECEAEEIQKLTAQLELEGDIPKRRAAATAAAVAIHTAHIHPPRTPVAPKTSSKEKETPLTGSGGGRKRSYSKKEKSAKNDEEEEETYCVCKKVSYGDMIACDNEDCTIVWFHFKCVGLKIKPKRGLNWYCLSCRGEKSTVMKKQ